MYSVFTNKVILKTRYHHRCLTTAWSGWG